MIAAQADFVLFDSVDHFVLERIQSLLGGPKPDYGFEPCNEVIVEVHVSGVIFDQSDGADPHIVDIDNGFPLVFFGELYCDTNRYVFRRLSTYCRSNDSDSPTPVSSLVVDSMEILLLHESVRKAWDARDRPVSRAREHAWLTGPSAKEAESWALQPDWRASRQSGKLA
ncbi:hypothetical protein [Halococcus sp. IIIV-5B]|uniref:hypothetical protein n=1 Tax=Halococcus sp. IIIV-5B TaxID=2321230 RepID=UPI0011C40559|nr:hypothetical protein [Halococcus sp. IIIV-5B]